MQRLLRRACHATNLAREQGVPLKPGLIALLDRAYDLDHYPSTPDSRHQAGLIGHFATGAVTTKSPL
jgi:hypothetical protein